MTSKIRYSFCSFCSALLVMATSIPVVQARVICPAFGNAVQFDNQECWFQNKCSLTNHCNSRQSIDIPLVIDHSGGHTIRVWGLLPSAGITLTCQAFAIDHSATIVDQSPRLSFPQTGMPISIELRSISVPSEGTAYVNCQADQGAIILSVNDES